jgi:hypothetical protein
VRFHNYGLLIGFKDAQECSLPEHITPLWFAEAARSLTEPIAGDFPAKRLAP